MAQKPINNLILPAEKSSKYLSKRIESFWKTFLYILIFILVWEVFGLLIFASVTESASISETTIAPLLIVLFLIVPSLVALLGLSYMSSHGRQTPGQRHMELIVVDRDDNYLSISKSILRNILFILSALPFGIGMLWTALNPSGRGWYDIILGTRVASIKLQGEKDPPEEKVAGVNKVSDSSNAKVNKVSRPVSKKLFIATCVFAILSFSSLIIPFGTIAGAFSSMNLLYYSLGFFCVSMILTLMFGFKSMRIIRSNAAKLIFFGGPVFFLFLIYLPANHNISSLRNGKMYEAGLVELGRAVENYHKINHKYPKTLKEMSHPFRGLYVYEIKKNNGKEYFVIKTESTHSLKKENGLAPPKQIKEMEYVEGKGLMVITE